MEKTITLSVKDYPELDLILTNQEVTLSISAKAMSRFLGEGDEKVILLITDLSVERGNNKRNSPQEVMESKLSDRLNDMEQQLSFSGQQRP